MDREDVIAIDLHGNIVTCQNVSITETAPNGASHHLGNIVDMSNINISSATHWKDRPHCSGCPVLMLCKGSCMFLQGENWHLSCDNAYSDNIALLALSFERITEGFVPVLIKGGDLPDHRRDIWGDILPHKESIKTIPIKVVA
jgi:uncharacterized protein